MPSHLYVLVHRRFARRHRRSSFDHGNITKAHVYNTHNTAPTEQTKSDVLCVLCDLCGKEVALSC